MNPQPGAGSDTGRSVRRRQAIIRAAAEVFLEHGYLGATTDEVAARASVSKQTVYKHFTDKQRLFAAVITETTAEVAGQLADIAASTLDGTQDVRKALRDLADGWLRGMLQPEVLRLRRLVIAEAERFPEVGRAWFDRGFDRALVLLGESLQRLADRGLLRGLGDPTLAADQFAGLVLYRPVNQVMFAGTGATPPSDTLSQIAGAAVDVFLAAYG
ncbi:MAG TPA: TetR/AcrR family transcriptional regulator [Streptosporangiaceae bacterium]